MLRTNSMIPMIVAVEEESRRWADTSTRWHWKARLLTPVSLWRPKKKKQKKLLLWVSVQGSVIHKIIRKINLAAINQMN